MINVFVCPFGGANLLLNLFEDLHEQYPGKYRITYVSFTDYGRLMYDELETKSVHIAPGEETGTFLSSHELDEAVRFSARVAEKHCHATFLETLQQAANHYAREIVSFLEKGRFDYVILFNGRLNLFITVLDILSERYGIKKIVFEQGLFRPHYVTVDGRGVNRLNSISSQADLYEKQPFPYQQTDLYHDLMTLIPYKREKMIDYKARVPKAALLNAYLAMKRQPRRMIFLRDSEGKDLLEAGIKKRIRIPRFRKKEEYPFPELERYRYVILCPFQVETDTQILLYSPLLSTMQELADGICAAVTSFNARQGEKTCVLFKTHPESASAVKIDNEDCFLIRTVPVPAILSGRCDLVITVNSTVGIEAIEKGIPVITLGQAFYNIDGLIAGHCKTLDDLPGLLDKALKEKTVDRNEQANFIAALKSNYQVYLYE